ncbi:IclR family transcriptional regulator [Sphaerisporangium fuscum]|uniref:IclR family transcriptional regulator n=1 Tax=Sphaerisporangium fuscum TaxID=2835868 RepID=UPI001BDC97F3|nr:IclR family transcriptional regulator [Sphaerisporangium fuscum]
MSRDLARDDLLQQQRRPGRAPAVRPADTPRRAEPSQHSERRPRTPDPERPPGSLEKGITLLSFLGSALQPVGLAELSRRTGLPKTTAYRLLGVLCRRGFARRVGLDYVLGEELSALTGAAPRMPPGARRVILPHALRLYELTHHTVNLAVAHGLEVAYVERLYGQGRVASPSDDVDRAPLHCTATGKVLLAHDRELEAAFRSRGTPRRLTRHTLVTPAALDRELALVRRQGVAHSREEFAEGLVCAAAPVFAADGRVAVALGVAADGATPPSARLTALVKATAQAASTAMARFLAGPPATGGPGRPRL